MKAKDYQLIQEFGSRLDGVLSISDLKVLFNGCTEAALYKKLVGMVDDGVLIKIKRGLYALPQTSLAVVSSRIEPNSYVTAGTVLARLALIGSIPSRRLWAVKVGRPRTYTCKLGVIEHLSVKPELFFGYDDENGVKYATPEKALLDSIYFTFKGRRLSYDVFDDVDRSSLDLAMMKTYLPCYDRRFRSYVEKLGVVHE
jgi:hypothetical protein